MRKYVFTSAIMYLNDCCGEQVMSGERLQSAVFLQRMFSFMQCDNVWEGCKGRIHKR